MGLGLLPYPFWRSSIQHIIIYELARVLQEEWCTCSRDSIGWEVLQSSYSLETSHTFFPSSDLPSHGVLQCFEAMREEVVLPLIYSSQDLRIVREGITFSRGYPLVFSIIWCSACRGFWKPRSSSILYFGGHNSQTLYYLIRIPDLLHFV